MRVLALDTATRRGSVAIVDDERVIVERVIDSRRSHAEMLPTALMDALGDAGLRPADIEAFAVGAGPGSFTGLRIGIAAMQGLAAVTGKAVVPVSMLLAAAEAASVDLAPGTRVGVWLDAYRRDVFSALYHVERGEPFAIGRLVELESPAVGAPAAVLERWSEAGWLPDVVSGDGARAFESLLHESVRVVNPEPLAAVIARIGAVRARHGEALAPGAVRALYVRRPDVEVARERAG